jgi:hypothetical protein
MRCKRQLKAYQTGWRERHDQGVLASFIGKGLAGIVPGRAMYGIGNPSVCRETAAEFSLSDKVY